MLNCRVWESGCPKSPAAIAGLLALIVVPPSLAAQPVVAPSPPQAGMVRDSDGSWRAPTIGEAIDTLLMDHDDISVRMRAREPAIALLRQEFGPMPSSQLERLVERLVEIALADETNAGNVRSSVRATLQWASYSPDRAGIRSEFAFAALVRIYETRAAWALELGGGNDPVAAADEYSVDQYRSFGARGGDAGRIAELSNNLYVIFFADPFDRGPTYLLDLFNASEPPRVMDRARRGEPEPLGSIWCTVGHFLHDAFPALKEMLGVTGSYLSPEDAREYSRYCMDGFPRIW